jgi:hypothetical protein
VKVEVKCLNNGQSFSEKTFKINVEKDPRKFEVALGQLAASNTVPMLISIFSRSQMSKGKK